MRPDDNEETQTKIEETEGFKAIKTALLGLGMPSADSIVKEWRQVLWIRGKAKDLPRALYMLKRSVHKATEAGEPIVRPSESGRWLGLIIAEEEDIQRRIAGVTRELTEREKRQAEERRILDQTTDPAWILTMHAIKALGAVGSNSDFLAKGLSIGRVGFLIAWGAHKEALDQGLNPEPWDKITAWARATPRKQG